MDEEFEVDALVIGAGPAGAGCALGLLRRGYGVLLVDRAMFPREKACGGCLSEHGVLSLERLGLLGLLEGAARIEGMRLRQGGREARLEIGHGWAVDRAKFDAGMVAEFERLGGKFWGGARARVLEGVEGDRRTVEVERCVGVGEGVSRVRVRAGVVMVCDGLGGTSLDGLSWSGWRIERGSRMGVSAMLEAGESRLEAGRLEMDVGVGGYVGRVRLGDGRVHVAAALDPDRVKRAGGPWRLMDEIVRRGGDGVGLMDGIESGSGREAREHRVVRMRGTPLLSRSRGLGDERLLVVGDACGYIEPFTGEGMAWALRGAIEAVEVLGDGWSVTTLSRWERAHACALRGPQRVCRAVRWLVRRPRLSCGAIGLLACWPGLGVWLSRGPRGGMSSGGGMDLVALCRGEGLKKSVGTASGGGEVRHGFGV